MTPFEQGKQAGREGKLFSDNPFVIGYTKLGSPKLGEDGDAWETGRKATFSRECSSKEIADAKATDISKFRRKSNRYYGY